jgi:hypothetical protein
MALMLKRKCYRRPLVKQWVRAVEQRGHRRPDGAGQRVESVHGLQGAAKDHRHYRYYVFRRLVRGAPQNAEHGWRLSAPEIERSASTAAQAMLADRHAIAQACEESGIDANRLPFRCSMQ